MVRFKFGQYGAMKVVGYKDAKNNLSEHLDEVECRHEEVLITRHGRPVAVLVSSDALAELRETIAWLSSPGIDADVRQAEAEYATGKTVSGDDLRADLGLRPR